MPDPSSLEQAVYDFLVKYCLLHEPNELQRCLIDQTQSLSLEDFKGLLGEAYRKLHRTPVLHDPSHPNETRSNAYIVRWRSYNLFLLLARASLNADLGAFLSQLPAQKSPGELRFETYKFYEAYPLTEHGNEFLAQYFPLFPNLRPEGVGLVPEDSAREGHDV